MEHLHVLIDIVSKNGILLLNISPMAGGTIPEDQQEVLLEMGIWLDRFGEAIYETRPWYTFGEGPTVEPDSEHPGGFQNISYTSDDVRYTTSGTFVYAIFLGKPEVGEDILLRAFSAQNSDMDITIKRITIPGSNEELEWTMTEDGLSLQIPNSGLDDMATVLKIETAV